MTQKKSLELTKQKTDSSNKLEHKQRRQRVLNKQRSRIGMNGSQLLIPCRFKNPTCIHQSPQQLYLDKSKYSEVVENKSKAIFFQKQDHRLPKEFYQIILYQQTTTYLLANDKVCHQFKDPPKQNTLKHNNRRPGSPAYFVKVKKKILSAKLYVKQ